MTIKTTKSRPRLGAILLTLSASVLLFVSTVFGATVTKLNDDALAPLRGPVGARVIRIDRLPIYDDKRSVIDLEEFQVWAPGAKVIIHGDNGVVLQRLDPPRMRFFRGLVNGDRESFAYFSMDPSGRNIQGLIVTRNKKFMVNSARRARQTPRGRLDESGAMDTFLTELDAIDEMPESGQPWQCEVDKMTAHSPLGRLHATGANGLPVTGEGISGTQSYAIAIEIETDYELYVNASSNSMTLTNYVTNLSGAVSTIYNRDLKTNVTQRNLHIYTSVSDPWNATTAITGLAELGTYYHNTYGGPVGSGVILLSGKATNSGIAWEGVVCNGDFFCPAPNGCGDPTFDNNYGGPYAWAGSIGTGGLGTVPDPNGTNNGTLYGMPSGGQQAYWPLLEYAHEFGHVMAGHHTHCITLTVAEATATGRNYVDLCFGSEGGCYAGATSAPLEKGTVMSYCHNIFSAGFPQSRYTFGQAIEVSHHELDDYILRGSGPVGGGTNIVTAVGSFTISAITAPSTVAPNSTGNTASAAAIPSAGATYAWTITNGAITAGAAASTVTFTAGASGTITLRATAYSPNGCGVSDTKTVAIGTLSPPTGVVATAITSTNVQVLWTAAIGATSYHVYRSSNGSTYSLVGSPMSSPFTDTTASASKAYLYKVRSFDGSSESADSNFDLATTVIFTDPTLTTTVTLVKAAHFTELRTAVNAVRALAGLGASSLTDPTLDSTVTVKAVHLTELRGALDPARSALGLAPVSYTDPTITAMSTLIKAAHVGDIRAGVQ
jgi:hypothetical protein